MKITYLFPFSDLCGRFLIYLIFRLVKFLDLPKNITYLMCFELTEKLGVQVPANYASVHYSFTELQNGVATFPSN